MGARCVPRNKSTIQHQHGPSKKLRTTGCDGNAQTVFHDILMQQPPIRWSLTHTARTRAERQHNSRPNSVAVRNAMRMGKQRGCAVRNRFQRLWTPIRRLPAMWLQFSAHAISAGSSGHRRSERKMIRGHASRGDCHEDGSSRRFTSSITKHSPRRSALRHNHRDGWLTDSRRKHVRDRNRRQALVAWLRSATASFLEQKLPDIDTYLPLGRSVCELRPGLSSGATGRSAAAGCLDRVWDYCLRSGFDLALISGVTAQRSCIAIWSSSLRTARRTPPVLFQPMMSR